MTTDILDLPGWTVLNKRLDAHEYELEAEYTVQPRSVAGELRHWAAAAEARARLVAGELRTQSIANEQRTHTVQ